MSATLSLSGISANIPQRFYSSGCRCSVSGVDGANGSQPSCYWHGRAYDHVQAWVNSLPQPSTIPAQPNSFSQPLPWPDALPVTTATAVAPSVSRPPAVAAAAVGTEWTTQCSLQPSGFDYAPAGARGSERNRTRRQSGACQPSSNKDRSEARDGSQALQFMKANHYSLSSDASVPSSVEDILNERKGNPEELLRCLGFGSHKSSLAVRLPARFLTNPSHAKGIEADAIIARHPELLTLKEPLTDALSVELLHKLPSYYQRELATTSDDAEMFSSLHRRFSERLSSAVGEAGVQQQQEQWRRGSLSLRRPAASGRTGRHGLSSGAAAGDKSYGGTGDLAGGRQDLAKPSACVEEGHCRPTATTSRIVRAATIPANRQNSMTASLSSLSDSVFMSNSDGVEVDYRYFDGDDMDGEFDPSRWMDPDDFDSLGDSSASRKNAGQHRMGSLSNDDHHERDLGVSCNGARRGFVAVRPAAAAVLQKHRSLDLQELSAAAAATLPASAVLASRNAVCVNGGSSASAAVGVSKFTVPVTVLVTSHDSGSSSEAADGAGGDAMQPSSSLLLRVKSEGRSPSTGGGGRTPTNSGSPMFLSVGVDSFESCESDTQTITGDMPDELASSVAGGGGISRCASTVDDDIVAVAGVTAAPVTAAGERGTASGNRLLLAVAPAMESFEMEEVQSIGDTTRHRTGTMKRSHSAQSDSSGFADTEDERLQSPPTAAMIAKEACENDFSENAEQRATFQSPSGFKMVDVVEAVLNMSAQKSHLPSPAALSVISAVELQSLDSREDLSLISTGQRLLHSSAAVTAAMSPPSLDSYSESGPTDDEYSSALDTQERRSSLGLPSECGDEPLLPTSRAMGLEQPVVILQRSQRPQLQPISTAVQWDCPDGVPLVNCGSDGWDDSNVSGVVHRQPPASAFRRAPYAASSSKEDGVQSTASATQQRTLATPALAASTTSRHLTVHGAPLLRQSAVDLNVVQPLPSGNVLRQSRVVGSLVQAGEAAVVEKEWSASLEPPALPNWCSIGAVPEEEGEEAVVMASVPTTSCGVAAPPAPSADLLEQAVSTTATVDYCRRPLSPQHLAPICPLVALSSPPGSDLSSRRRSATAAGASDSSSSAVLMALVKPASPVTARAASDADLRLVQRAVQRYRATAYETEDLLDALVQSLPDDVRQQLVDELESLADVRQNVAHEAVLLEAAILERLDATRSASAARSASRSGSPLPPAQSQLLPSLNVLSSSLTLPGLQQHQCVRRQSAAGSLCSSKTSQTGVVDECTKLLKEQIYQQKLLESRGGSIAAVGSPLARGSHRPDSASLQQQVTALETKQKYEQRIAELEVTTLKLMLQAKEEEIKRLKLLSDID